MDARRGVGRRGWRSTIYGSVMYKRRLGTRSAASLLCGLAQQACEAAAGVTGLGAAGVGLPVDHVEEVQVLLVAHA